MVTDGCVDEPREVWLALRYKSDVVGRRTHEAGSWNYCMQSSKLENNVTSAYHAFQDGLKYPIILSKGYCCP